METLICDEFFDMEYPIDGVKVESLDENETYIKFHQKQHGYKRGFVRLMPYNQVMPKDYMKHAKKIHDFQIRDNDVWISSFPKCGRNYFTPYTIHFRSRKIMIHDLIFFAIDLGTTWTQEMVWCIMNNLDFKAAKESILEKRVPYFEYFVVIFNNLTLLHIS